MFTNPHRHRILTTAILSTTILLAATHFARAANFNISTASTTAQTLATGQTGVVTATGSLTLGSSTVPITVTGNSTITNSGQIIQTGAARGITNESGTVTLTITNNAGALIQTANGDAVRVSPTTSSISLDNYGTITSLNGAKAGSQAVDWNNITTGSNVLTNYSTGLIQASDADSVRPGVNGVVNNFGTIRSTVTTDTGSDAIDAQKNTGVTLNNYSTGLVDSSRHGITGGAANATVTFTTTINNSAGGIIRGNNGSGINLDGFNANQTAIIVNGGTITGNGVTGDGDGVDVDGLVNITNTGTIRSINAFSAVVGTPAQSEGITVGGGTIVNSGLIEGLVNGGPSNTNAVGRGISLLGNDSLLLPGTREAIYGNATVTNQAGGVIRGDSDSGIAVDGPASGFTVTINNNAGATIRGGATLAGLAGTNAAIRTGADNDTINNAGTIDGSSNGRAIDMGAGNNTLNITGGAASILGDINGGTGGANAMKLDLGAGNNFAYTGSISNFNTVEAKSGTITLSGMNAYTGVTKLSGGTLVLDGANRISSLSALDLNGGTLEIMNIGAAHGQTFSSLSLDADSVIDLDFTTSLTFSGLGTIALGRTLTVLDFADGTYTDAFRIFGDYSANADFLRLINWTKIDGLAATFYYDGVFTDVVPVPEPATIGFGIALMGVALARRRRTATA